MPSDLAECSAGVSRGSRRRGRRDAQFVTLMAGAAAKSLTYVNRTPAQH
jgi:hypothetical protein